MNKKDAKPGRRNITSWQARENTPQTKTMKYMSMNSKEFGGCIAKTTTHAGIHSGSLYLPTRVAAARALDQWHVPSSQQALAHEVRAVAPFATLVARLFAPIRPRRAAVVRSAAVMVRRIPPFLILDSFQANISRVRAIFAHAQSRQKGVLLRTDQALEIFPSS